ncbi:MAG: hypothetical protein RLZZ171_1874 [Cyanobacteriota bacterium]
MQTRRQVLLTGLFFALILSYISTVINWEGILGAFATGLILRETEKQTELEQQSIPVADFFVPRFFVCVGAKTDLSILNSTVPSNRSGLIIATFLTLVAILGKVITEFTVFGNFELNKLAFGVAMIPRGEVGLVFKKKGSIAELVDKVQE